MTRLGHRGYRALLVTVALAALAACGEGDGNSDEGNSVGGASAVVGLASEICRQQIACGYQSLSQESCQSFFESYLSGDELLECLTCMGDHACDVERRECIGLCSLQD